MIFPHPLFLAMALACVATMTFGSANMLHARDKRFLDVPRSRYWLHFHAIIIAAAGGAFAGFSHPHVSIMIIGLVLMVLIACFEGGVAIRATFQRMRELRNREQVPQFLYKR